MNRRRVWETSATLALVLLVVGVAGGMPYYHHLKEQMNDQSEGESNPARIRVAWHLDVGE